MTKTLTLPSGKTAEIRLGKGYDLLQAQMKAKNAEEISYALIAELVVIDGLQLVYEDVLEMDLSDVIALQGEISGKLVTVNPKETQEKDVPETKTETQITTLASPTAKA